MRLFAAPLGLALVSILLPAPVHAEGGRTVLVLPYAPLSTEVTQAQADEVTSFLREQVGQQDGLEVKEAEGAGASASVEEKLAPARVAVAEALQTAAKAGELARARKVKAAADAYASAAGALLARFEGLESLGAVEQALWQQASLRYLLGSEDDAKKSLSELVRLSPGFTPPAGADPLLAAAYDKARQEAKAAATGRLELVTSPPGASVTLDGRDVGETPLAVEGLVPGVHYVRLLKPGAGVVWQVRTVVAASPDRWETVLAGRADGAVARVTSALRANRIDDVLAKAAAEAGREAGAAFVLVGALRPVDDKLDVRSLLVESATGRLAELSGLSLFPTAMTGIDVYALATDVAAKSAAFEPTTGLEGPFFEGLAVQAAGALPVVRVDVAGGSSSVRGNSAGDGEGRKGRRVVNSAPAPVATPPVPKEPAARPAADDGKPRQRVRTRIGEPGEPKEGEETPAVKPETGLDLRAPSLDRRLSDLSPEELRRLQEVERKVGASPVRRPFLLWGAAGAVVAVGVGWLAYGLLSDKVPESTTVQVRWSAAAR
ncbi:MAG: hypothetical protein RL199_324 [Pseudomonadota bacterium]|jgi:hypothetical protein